MFEQATRQKLRFDSPKGLLSVEDLWDLPLTSKAGHANLDDIAKDLNHQLKSSSEEISFVTPVESSNTTLQLEFNVVKHIIDVRVAERDKAALEAERRAKKQKIMAIIDQKQDEALSASSLEDLQKQLESL